MNENASDPINVNYHLCGHSQAIGNIALAPMTVIYKGNNPVLMGN